MKFNWQELIEQRFADLDKRVRDRIANFAREIVAKDEQDRFWSKVDRSGKCWIWIAGVGNQGYGAFTTTRTRGTTKVISAHRYSYELAKGPIPPGLVIDHLCRNRRCVNPEHLEAVTVAENTLRGHRSRRAER